MTAATLKTDKLRQLKKQEMLEALAELGNVSAAARLIGIARDTHYGWVETDPDYAARIPGVLQAACENLEAEARRRAVEGVEKPVYQGKELVGTVRESSDTLLIFLLKGANPEKYKDRSHQEHSGRVQVSARPFKDVSDDDLETMLQAAKAFKALKEGAQDNG